MRILLGSILFIIWAAAVAISDCRCRRVPNALAMAGLATAAACALLHVSPFNVTLRNAVIGALLGFGALLPFYLLGWMGAADVKIFAVLGTWCGASALPGIWVVATLGAAVNAIGLLVIARTPLSALGRDNKPTFAVAGRRAPPYAAMLVAAATLVLAFAPSHGAVS